MIFGKPTTYLNLYRGILLENVLKTANQKQK